MKLTFWFQLNLIAFICYVVIIVLFHRANPNESNVCRAKLACGLLSGRYSERNASAGSDQHQSGIKPGMFKSLVGKGHPEFSTKHQQDVVEFLLHLINVTEVLPIY